jgi:phage terminase small subunit
MRMSKEEIRESLDQIPLESIFNKGLSQELTPKQKRFAKEVAKGEVSKAEAYRRTYNTNQKPKAVGSDACKLASKPSVAQEIERVKLALASMEYRSPSHLKALVVDSLTKVLLDEDAKHSDKINASKVIGTISGVDMFKDIKEVNHVINSKLAKDNVLNEIKRLIKGTDSNIVDVEARSLLDELSGSAAHLGAAPSSEQAEPLPDVHTIPLKSSDIPLKSSDSFSSMEEAPTPSEKS